MNSKGWSLEVVRGRDAGQCYALAQGPTVLGNALNGTPGLDLSRHEADGPRRMAARQAQVEWTGPGLSLRDLDSPGGTFVNRQRILPGQARPLQPGDLIQLGGVQLKVVAPAPAEPPPQARTDPAPKPPPRPARVGPSAPQATAPRPAPAAPSPPVPVPSRSARPGPLARPFSLATGATCRSWDDFLTISAQRWDAMREELISGRLAGFLVSSGHPGMAPSASGAGTPDERLDAWLASLPTTRQCEPELEVHPPTLIVRAGTGGGSTRHVLRITNTGYRLLRSSVRIDPASASWIRVLGEFSAGPFVTIESTEVPLEVRLPEVLGAAMTGSVVVESNGGTRQVSVRIERLPPPESIPELSSAIYGVGGPSLAELVARQPAAKRLILGAAGGLVLRSLVALGGLLPLGGVPAEASPHLAGAALVCAGVGGLVAAGMSARRGMVRDVPFAGFAGGFAGMLLAALAVAVFRAFEPILGQTLGQTLWATVPLAALIGAGLAGLSVLFIPPTREPETTP